MVNAERASVVTPPGDRAIWNLPEPADDARRFSESPLIDSLLARRGVRSEAEALAFLQPETVPLGDPFLLPDMQVAVEMTRAAIAEGKRVVVFGDYDVDGLTSTSMLVRVLRRLGADPIPVIPHRRDDGYGVNPTSIARIIEARPELLVTVDCGSSSPNEFAQLADMGVSAIVLDHHHYTGQLPDSVAFVSARRPDNRYVCCELAAVGVAHAFTRALLGTEDAEMYLPYVAIGSVADVVQLLGENRTLVASGLAKLRRWSLPGLRALCAEAGIRQRQTSAWDIGFALGPRLNAAGRVDTPQIALDLLLADDEQTASPLAQTLDELNRVRQGETRRVLAEAEAAFAALGGPSANAAIVVSGAGWNAGVVGLVAARLAERHCRPAFVLDDADGVSRGSARSAGGVNVVEALETCRDILDRFGGHAAAAGLSLDTRDVPELRQRLNHAVLAMLDGQMPRREHDIDAVADHADLSLRTVDLLQQLEPCGQGNPAPTLMFRNVRHRYARPSGDGAHLLFQVVDQFGRRHKAVMFGAGGRARELATTPAIDLIGRLEADTWQGPARLGIKVADFRAAGS